MMPEPDEKDDDKNIFREAMADVTPLSHDRVSLRPRPKTIKRRKTGQTPDIADTLSDDFIPPCGEFLEFMRPGVQKSLLKQMRTGRMVVEDSLDLHGLMRDAARKTLLEFITRSQARNYKIVCVVHGKGYNSEDGRPVLKAMVNKWLQNIDAVLAFTTAQPRDGGTGAVYVLLKRAV
ncbi:MAG: DNA mismatch repair protein MutS [Gammaproteobacteria bacterium]|nr:MAG: DNA mismatch repair protein MutS [Gammaproteobacteria bacterium]